MQMLSYYGWLEQNGMKWNLIVGVADVTERERRYGKGGFYTRAAIKNAISYKLSDGTIKVVRDVPYDMDVIFNRKRA